MEKHMLTTFRVAVYGVLIENGKILLTDTRVPSGVITNFPGGGLSLGEAPVEALIREFYEETSLPVQVRQLLYCSHQFQQNPEYPHEQLIHIYFKVERSPAAQIVMSGNGDDVVAATWLSLEELPGRRILEPDQEFIRQPSFRALF
jgi:8-oxo-dGTP pyrophosphatase MutT (NUDIX family)